MVGKKWLYGVVLSLTFSFGISICYGQKGGYALSGTLVTNQGIEDGLVLIEDGVIRGVGPEVAVPSGMPVIKTNGVIFPGLIDVHDHLVWNVLPRWKPKNWPSRNRYDWQNESGYKTELADPEAKLIERGFGCDMERYAEIKAMLGGATSVVGSFGPTDENPHRNDCDRGLARNLDYYSGLYSSNVNAEPLEYQVFPLEIPWTKAQAIRDNLYSGKTKSFLIHVAEGKDASAEREFNMVKAEGFLRPGVSFIHAVALKSAQFREMKANGVGLVWSPRSNFELYNTTTDIASAKAVGLTIALAPDWSPSGSNSMIEELRYVRTSKTGIENVFTDSELLQMVTSNPAKLAGVDDKVGTLTTGLAADIVVLPKRGNTALSALVDAKPGSVMLVIVGGRAILGEPELMRNLVPDQKLDSLIVCNYEKSLNITHDTAGESWEQIEENLRQELKTMGISLANLAKCN